MASNNELTSTEKDLFKYTIGCKFEEVKRVLAVENASVNCVDEDGLTPLQHACYTGDYDLCKLLLDFGADINLSRHASKYSAFTFACLAGKIDVVCLLLEHGASTSQVNSINKTAVQMAAFVGNRNVVNFINNFIYLEEVREIVKQVDAALESISLPVYKLAIKTNIHPVSIVMHIQDNMCILENAKKVIEIYKILCEKQLKEKGNELLSLKFHHLAYIITACDIFIGELKVTEPNNMMSKDILNPLIKHWIRGNEIGFPFILEKFIRQDIKEYQFHECSEFQHMIRMFAAVKKGSDCSAFSIINRVINNHRGIKNTVRCATCGESAPERICSICKVVNYCSSNCQKLHWFTHKGVCYDVSVIYRKQYELKGIIQALKVCEVLNGVREYPN